VDDLAAILGSRRWVKRRVDRIEFLDLTTVRRTIVFMIDLAALAATRSSSCELIPLGWFMPWANAEVVLVDEDRRVTTYLTSRESDDRVAGQICQRLRNLGMHGSAGLVRQIREHRTKPRPRKPTCGCSTDDECAPGYVELMNDKWGCRAVRRLLDELQRKHPDRKTVEGRQAGELVQILLAWQTNFVLFAQLATARASGRATLQLSYDEELLDWEPPWERRNRELGGNDLPRAEARECRRHISRGGPFSQDLDALLPWGPRGRIAGARSSAVRSLGRRGLLGLTWHVAWHQASGLDVTDHHVEVILPPELTIVRMRMLRIRGRRRYATRADQVGSRATIVTPPLPDRSRKARPPVPTLLSMVITERSAASWYGGFWIASLTGAAILASALWRLREIVDHTDAVAAILVVAPTLVSTLLAVRAGSEIAEQLTAGPRRLIGAVGALAALCAVGLVVQGMPVEPSPIAKLFGAAPQVPDLTFLWWLWALAGCAMLYVAAALLFGARRIQSFIRWGQRLAPREVPVRDHSVGNVLNPRRAPRIPPPDRWLAANEGDLVPWGWLYAPPSKTKQTHADRCFWQDSGPAELVDWVHQIFGYVPVLDDAPAPAAEVRFAQSSPNR
jgi:hypothetical protein